MRLATIILALGAIAVGLVHLRRAEMVARYEVQQLQVTQVRLRRTLWDQQVRLSRLMTPAELRRRTETLDRIGDRRVQPELARTNE